MPLNTKLVPVALGLSIVTATAYVVYYLFKKDEDEEPENSVTTSRVNIIEVPVPKSIVPALIGRSGSNIKDIELKTGAKINFNKFSDQDYDVCVIKGKSEDTQMAETMVHDFIKKQPTIVVEVITIPGWACGKIIGYGGDNISSISHRSGARIKIEAPSNGDKMSERQVSIRGTKEQIENAKQLIEQNVTQEKCRREIEQSRRSPRHAPAEQSPSPPASCASDHSEEQEGAAPIEVYVSAVSSPSRFWVQFVGPQVAQLDELNELMTDYYGKKENREAHALSHVSVGQVVAAVFRHDGKWYRARVHDIRPNEFDASQQVADVFYLDYGDSEYVATHELCELRADLLRLRFQAMECFLAGVRPAPRPDVKPERWHPQAIERFEELTQVARWKALLSRTCTYKKTATAEGEKEQEIPGIKLFDATDEGELDIGGVLISEGWAEAGPHERPSPPRHMRPPFGDLGNSRVLGMLEGRSSSLPKDHKDDHGERQVSPTIDTTQDNDGMTTSKSLASGLQESSKPLSISNFDLSYPDKSLSQPHLNGSHENFLHMEKQNVDKEGSLDTLVPSTPIHMKTQRDEFKANMNRIDSHHSNLEALGRSQHDVNK
ncbi:tudor and KH domain containing protein papi isoform X2 [Anticarsia gemmatalis]|uniref:tudor and KH domain containing protein papi isoform X2 n=1 Tax=Anticarsia gemmatalis TaxID=129554 RepID=UPI003F762172